MLETIWQDIRHGARMLAKNPGFSLTAILSIAIGVGANAAMFSVADGLIFRPLPIPDANGLMDVIGTTPTGEDRNIELSYPDYADLRDRAQSFEGLAALDGMIAGLSLRRDEPAQGSFGQVVSANFFDLLHVRPLLGRWFVADEDRVAGRDAVVVLGYETWREQFGADPGIVGREIRLSGRPFTVVGVAPEGFTGAEHFVTPAFYVPLAMIAMLQSDAAPTILEQRDQRRFRVVGRLKSDASLEQTRLEAERIARALQQEHPTTNERRGFLIRREMDSRLAEYAPVAALSVILIGMAIAVLLVACANVAGLLTSRAPVRAREMALRLAIGGSRGRLMRQLITESALISTMGALAGLALGYGGIRSFQQFQIVSDARVRMTYELDERALVVGLVVAVISALLSSAVPAWRSTRSRDLTTALRNTAAPASRVARLWGRHGLVASQIALTLVLLTVALSFYRAFEAEYGRGPGFRTDHILLTNLDPSFARYDQRQSDTFYRLLKERAAAIPGVTSVALTSFVPLSQDSGGSLGIVPEGVVLPPGVERLTVAAARVDDAYFDTVGVAIVSGRAFRATDTLDAPLVAIVSRGMARRYWPDEDPLGKRIRITSQNEAFAEVVGVAEDIKFRLFTPASTPFLYVPRLQHPSTRGTLVVRTEPESAAVAEQMRTAIMDTDRDVPILSMRTMEAFYYANARNLNTVTVRTIALMGIMGLVLALVGLYGLMAYAVSQRTREIGIRMAIGALPASVLQMILRQGSLPSFLGIAAGVAASAGAGRLIQGAFPGTGGDAITYLTIVPVVLMVVALAAYIPARRAARIDPLVALRHD